MPQSQVCSKVLEAEFLDRPQLMEAFIEEIKKYPAIWNVHIPEYYDSAPKKAAWMKICQVFWPDFDEMNDDDKNEIYLRYYNKWIHVKTAYSTTLRKRRKTPYIYAKHLSFLREARILSGDWYSDDDEEQDNLPLQHMVKKKRQRIVVSSSNEKQEEQQPERIEETKQPEQSERQEENKKRRKQDLESTIIDFIKSSQIQSQPEIVNQKPDPDRLFFESLIPTLGEFSQDQKLHFRCVVLNIIRRMRMPQNPKTLANSQQSGLYYSPNQAFSHQPPPHLSLPSTLCYPNNFAQPQPNQQQLVSANLSISVPATMTNQPAHIPGPNIPSNIQTIPPPLLHCNLGLIKVQPKLENVNTSLNR